MDRGRDMAYNQSCLEGESTEEYFCQFYGDATVQLFRSKNAKTDLIMSRATDRDCSKLVKGSILECHCGVQPTST